MNFCMKGHYFTRTIRTSLQFPDGRIFIYFVPEFGYNNEFIEVSSEEQENLPLQLPQFSESLKND